MRIGILLTIYVSLAAGAFAEERVQQWAAIHGEGLAANARQDYAAAAGLFEQSWPLARRAEERGISANDLGQTFRRLGRLREAREWLERAYREWRAVPQAGPNLAIAAAGLGDLYRDAGDYARAELLLREALSASNHDRESKEVIRNNLGDLLREEGRGPEARALFLDALAEPEVSWLQRANALSGLADVERQAGDWEESERNWNEVLETARAQKHELLEAIAARGLASLWRDAGTFAGAEPLSRRAVWLGYTTPRAPAEQVATALSGLAAIYRGQDKLALAEDAWGRALQLERPVLGDTHPQVAWLMEMLSDVYSARGERELARDYATRALDAMSGSFGENSLPAAVALANRATTEERARDPDAAAGDYARALGIARTHPENNPLRLALTRRYAALLKSMHRDREAKRLATMAKSFR